MSLNTITPKINITINPIKNNEIYKNNLSIIYILFNLYRSSHNFPLNLVPRQSQTLSLAQVPDLHLGLQIGL